LVSSFRSQLYIYVYIYIYIYITIPTGLRRGDSATAAAVDDGSLINSSGGSREEIHTRALPDGYSRGVVRATQVAKLIALDESAWWTVHSRPVIKKNVFCCVKNKLRKIRRTPRTWTPPTAPQKAWNHDPSTIIAAHRSSRLRTLRSIRLRLL